MLGRFAGQGFGAFKPALADAVIALLAPLADASRGIPPRSGELDRLLADGADKAAALAAPTLAEAYEAVGLSRQRIA